MFVQTGTVIAWQRKRFRDHWAKLSQHGRPGRPLVSKEIRILIREISAANTGWGSPRIVGELCKLRINVAKSTVETYRVLSRKPPSPTWKTFLMNHVHELASIDFLVVPTVRFKVLFVLVWDTAPKYLLRDRDGIYGDSFQSRVQGISTKEVLAAPRSRWQNPYAKRLIGSIRRDCLDHVIVLNDRHLKRILNSYFDYTHHWRTHLSLGMDSPETRPVQLLPVGKVVQFTEVGGLHHHFERMAA